MTTTRSPNKNWGPWSANLDRAERIARLRCMRTITMMLACTQTEFIGLLRKAESDDSALAEASDALNSMPALLRRHIISNYAAVR